MPESTFADDGAFTTAADRFMASVLDALSDLDPDEVDCDLAMGVLTMQFADGQRFVMNRQTAAHQIWFAHGVTAYHFAFDPEAAAWLDTKGRGDLRAVVARALSDKLGRAVRL